jgi:hypothetical protein
MATNLHSAEAEKYIFEISIGKFSPFDGFFPGTYRLSGAEIFYK